MPFPWEGKLHLEANVDPEMGASTSVQGGGPSFSVYPTLTAAGCIEAVLVFKVSNNHLKLISMCFWNIHGTALSWS